MRISTAMAAALVAAAAVPAFAQGHFRRKPEPPPAPATQVPQAGQIVPSAGARQAIVELQAAVTANDPAAIQAKVAAAQAVATTKEDRYLIANLQLKAAVAANNNVAAAAAIDAIAASAYLDTAKLTQLYSSLGVKAFRDKQFDQAAGLFERAVSLNPQDGELPLLLADARLAQGRKADALAIYQRTIQARVAAGQKPSEALYKRAVQAAYDAKAASATDLARQWLTAYPSPDSWRNSIAIYRNSTKSDLEGTVDLLRLMRAAGVLTSAADLAMYASALTDQSNFIEAQTALDQALQANRVSASDPQLAGVVASLRMKPRPTAADLTAAAKSAQSGMALLRIGDRFYGLGEYAKAAETYRLAKAKPGVDPNLANLRIGIALAGAGDKPGATAALKSVSGARSGIADFWLLYLQSRA